MNIPQRITPFLSYTSQAEEAANFYVSLVPDSKLIRLNKNPATGDVLTVEFILGGIQFIGLNTGQAWNFTHAFSLSVACETQTELDRLWSALTEGGQEVQCGWCTDRFGMSWQIVPAQMSKWIADPDPAKVGRVMEAMFKMVKLDIHTLQVAYEGHERTDATR